MDFSRFSSYNPIKPYEDRLSTAYFKYLTSLEKSQESIDSSLVRSFVQKAVAFISNISKIILRLALTVATFFKKLIMSAMDEFSMRTYSEFYQTHKETIRENYNKYASKVYTTALPPKNINSFSSDNRIAFSVERTVNLLSEIDRTFKQRVELWDQYNKKVGDRGTNSLFDRVFRSYQKVDVNISDSMLLGSLGIRIAYDYNTVSFYDRQVKDYIGLMIKSNTESGDIVSILTSVFNAPKRIINVYLFGKDEVKPEVVPVSEFLKFTGPDEFNKLEYSDMSRIKANSLVINALVGKMEVIAKKLESSGSKFCGSLQSNIPFIVKASSNEEGMMSGIEAARELIIPLLSVSRSFYSYFSTVLLNYSMYYVRHRKALYESAVMLCEERGER
jgi:hypothetical protein